MGSDGIVHNKLTVKNQAFGLITSESVLDDTFDCICGLAYPTMANTGSINGTPLFDTMMQQKILHNNVFAFYMSLCKEEKSELVFGWYDETKFTGTMTWHPVVFKFFWSLQLDDIKVIKILLT